MRYMLNVNLHSQTSVKDRDIAVQRNTDVRNDSTEMNTLSPSLLVNVASLENLHKMAHKKELEISVHVFFFW